MGIKVHRLIERLHPAAVLVWAVSLLALVAVIAVEALGPVVRWEVSERDRTGQLTVYNASPEGGSFGLPVEMGDFDGDGKIDLAISPMAAPSGPFRARRRAGEVYVYRGDGAIRGTIDRRAMGESPAGLTLWGARPDDFLGTELFSADVNADGITDLIVGAQNYDGADARRENCGGAFVILGRPGLLGTGEPPGPIIDLAAPVSGVIAIWGKSPGDRLGIWVEAGDLDGDGAADLLLGADQAPGSEVPDVRQHAGSVVVIYGGKDLPPAIDLASPPPGVSVIKGRDAEDHFGSSIHARDLDRDGHLDLIAAAALNRLSAGYGGLAPTLPSHADGGGDGPGNVRPECGEVYVIFGDASGGRLPPALDLALPPREIEERITVIYGEKSLEAAGEEVVTGDFNGDGFPDLAVGALTATNPDGHIQAGAVHLIYWRPGLRGVTIDFGFKESFPPGLEVSDILGLNRLDILGDTLSAGDFNHDGIDDLAVGIPHETLGQRSQIGAVAVLFGRPEPFPLRVYPDLPDSSLRISFVYGAGNLDFLSYSMEAQDYDGDGYTDLFPNAMRGDGAGDGSLDAGEAYLVSGYYLSDAVLQVAGVDPRSGPLHQEVTVSVRGSGFTRDEDTRVLVGGVQASEVRVISGNRITCRFPGRGEPGEAAVTVENRYGAHTLERAFGYSQRFLRGDSSGDLVLDLSDAIVTLDFLFLGRSPGECLDRHDANDDGQLDLSDPIFTLSWLFLGGRPPPPPFPEPGFDESADPLGCF